MKPISILFALLLAFVLTACGGGGGSSDEPMTGTPPPTTPTPSGPSQAEIDAEAMRVAGAIGTGTPAPTIGSMLPTGLSHTKGAISVPMEPEDTDVMKSDAAVAAIAKWKSNAYTRAPSERVEDTIVLYNNVGPNTDEAYNDFFSATGMLEALPAGVSGNNSGTLSFTADTAMKSSVFDVAGFPTGDRQTFTIEDDDEVAGDQRHLNGSFYGVDGQFQCGQASCTVTTDKDAQNISLSLGWTFVPTGRVADIMVKGVIPDMDYMVMGYWLEATTDTAGDTTYAFSHISGGARAFEGASIGTRDASSGVITGAADHVTKGTATYTGPATGMYIKKTLDDEGGAMSPFSSGQFVANAKLVANFGGNQVAASNQFSVSGTISSFVDADGSPISNRWSLKLMKADISGDGSTGWSVNCNDCTSGGTSDGGSWSGNFFGLTTAPDGPDADTDPDPIHPGAIAGTFNGHFSNGHVAGAFGASKN